MVLRLSLISDLLLDDPCFLHHHFIVYLNVPRTALHSVFDDLAVKGTLSRSVPRAFCEIPLVRLPPAALTLPKNTNFAC